MGDPETTEPQKDIVICIYTKTINNASWEIILPQNSNVVLPIVYTTFSLLKAPFAKDDHKQYSLYLLHGFLV